VTKKRKKKEDYYDFSGAPPGKPRTRFSFDPPSPDDQPLFTKWRSWSNKMKRTVTTVRTNRARVNRAKARSADLRRRGHKVLKDQ